MPRRCHRLALFLMPLALAAATLAAQGPALPIEWTHWGGDAGHRKYSPAADLTPDNVGGMELAWTWRTVDRPMPEYKLRPGNFENTPIMIDDALYVSTSYHRVVALDAESGRQRWVFDPRTYEEGPPMSGTGLNSRGVAFWRGDNGEVRLFIAGRQRLFAVDAKTGQPIQGFAGKGAAALNENLSRDVPRLHTQATSPPVIYKNLVIVGTGVPDRLQYRSDPPGTVQAFDARTGRRAWVFYTIPQSATDAGADTWGNNSWRIAGHANVWAPMSLDVERGLLYLPTSTPSGDYWGGWRPGANLFAESLVCLDANTGERRWHFQAVHHGLWDYDFASAPTLARIQVNGASLDVVAQVSKQGFAYVFDRVTGRPVWPIEERPVDTTTDVPGERVWPTQPFPTKPPPLGPQGVTLQDANDLTPEIKRLAEEQLRRFRLGPLFTPPSLRGTVQRPSQYGIANWGGAAFDPGTGLLFVKAADTYHISTVCKNDGRDPFIDWEYGNYCGQYGLFSSRGPQDTTAPPVNARPPERAPDTLGYSGDQLGAIPLTKPPYAHLVAVDLNRGDIAWRVPFGEGSPAIRQHPLLKGVALPERLGTPGSPGPIVTASGLVFIGGGDPYLYAFDARTGREIARVSTPERTSGNPMTYRTRGGRQFVVIAIGAGPEGGLAAFALPTAGGRTTTTTTSDSAVRLPGSTPAAAYARVCEPCHGPNGRNGIAPALVPMTRGVEQVLAIVREGIGQMPPISPRELPDDEVRGVIAYLRGLR